MPAQPSLGRSAAARRVVMGVALIVAIVQTFRVGEHASKPTLASQDHAATVTGVLHQLVPQVGRTDLVRVEGVGDMFNKEWVGVLYGLDRRHTHFLTTDGASGQKWGADHRWNGQRTDYTLTIVASEPYRPNDPVQACNSDPRQRRIAAWNQLSPAERREYRDLLVANYRARGKLAPAMARRLDSLHTKSFELFVYRGPRVCG